jgi:hypothetical protein
MRILVIPAVFALALTSHVALAGKIEAPAVIAQTPAPGGGAAKGETPDPGPGKPAEKPDVFYDPGLLPDAVRTMRDKILEAALSGDTDKLKIVIQSNEMPPAFSFGEDAGDPIAAMKTQSNDGEGREVMAILAEVLEAGYVHVDKGTPQEMYVWPYFAQYPIDKLTPPQTIELFKIVTSFEYTEMKEFGAYNFYRVGIGPDGTWHFFVSGD